MKKLALGLGLALLAVALVGLTRLLAGGRGAPSVPSPAAEPGAGTGRAAALDGAEGAAGRDGAGGRPAGARAAVAAELEDGVRRGWTGATAAWIDGRVQIPPGVPADPTLRVLVLRERLTPETLYGAAGLVASRGQPGEEWPELLSTAPVTADGAFRAPLPEDVDVAWLALDGRFLSTADAARVAAAPGEVLPRPLIPRVGAWITGSVVPLPDAGEYMPVALEADSTQFALVPPDGTWLFTRGCRVDRAGRFELRAVDPARPYELDVYSEDFATWTRGGIVVHRGRELALEAELSAGATVRGRVLGPEGEPVAGATVDAVKTVAWGFPGPPGFDVATTQCDAEGRFELLQVPPGQPTLVARAEGYLESAARTIDAPEGETIEIADLELAAGSVLAGRVLWPDGSTALDATVIARFDPAAMLGMSAMNMARGADGSAQTDADGRFRIPGLGRGPFLVETRQYDAPGGALWTARAAGVEPDTEDLELVLSPPAVVRGRVVDADGEPVPEFTVLANSQGAIFFVPGEGRRESFRSAEGAFVLDGLGEGAWEIQARAEGHGPSAAAPLRLPLPLDAEPLLLILEPRAGVAGTVVSPTGEPLAGARVTLQVEASKTFARMTGRLDLPEAWSRDDGSFLLEGLAAGEPTLFAEHPDHAESAGVEVTVPSGGVAEGVVLALREGGTLSGLVYDREGEEMRGGQVFVQDPTTYETTTVRTESDGTFLLERVRPGKWQVTAMVGAIAPSTEEEGGDTAMSQFLQNMRFTMAAVREGEETHVVLGAPPEDPIVVHGEITHDGEPVREAVVSFMAEGARIDALKMDQLDASGAYEVTLEEPGRYLVQVQLFGGAGVQQSNIEYTESVPEGERHELDLELPVASIHGRVLGPEGEALAGARVSLTRDGGIKTGTFLGGHFTEVVTDAVGRYELSYLRPGRYTVAAGGAAFGGVFGTDGAHGRVLRAGVAVDAGERLEDVDFRLEASGDVSGVVRDATGRTVLGAAIFVRDAGGRLLERFTMITSGPDGSFRYRGLAPGEYSVSARTVAEVASEEALVRVRSSESATCALTLAPGTVLAVRVLDPSGGEVSGARVSAVDERGRAVHGMVSYSEVMSSLELFRHDEQRLGPLPPGRYEVTAEAADGRRARKPVTLDGRPERRLTLRLR